jgi:hypothetical protein
MTNKEAARLIDDLSHELETDGRLGTSACLTAVAMVALVGERLAVALMQYIRPWMDHLKSAVKETSGPRPRPCPPRRHQAIRSSNEDFRMRAMTAFSKATEALEPKTPETGDTLLAVHAYFAASLLRARRGCDLDIPAIHALKEDILKFLETRITP